MFILINLSNSGFLSLVSTAIDVMERKSIYNWGGIFLFFPEHVFGKLKANSDDLFETSDPVVSWKDVVVLPDLKLVSKAKSNTSFFILTSDEAYLDKLAAIKGKEEKEKKKRPNIKYNYSEYWKIFLFNYENCSTSY